MRAPLFLLAVGAGLLGCAGAARAHDFWIEPKTFRADAASIVPIELKIGHQFDGKAVMRDKSRFFRFVVADPNGKTQDVVGRDGKTPAGLVRPRQAGFHVIGYHSRPSFIELNADKFESYLRAEGLEQVIAHRRKSGQEKKPGRESYTRCAKSLLQVGDHSEGFDRRIGMPLEIIPETDPSRLSDKPTSFLVLYDGKPCGDVLVVAVSRAAPRESVRGRTDSSGRLGLSLKRPGAWCVKAIHMIPAPEKTKADWQSFWASLSFERRASPIRENLPAGVDPTHRPSTDRSDEKSGDRSQ